METITPLRSTASSNGSAHYQSPVESKLKTALGLHDLNSLVEINVSPDLAKFLLSLNTRNRRVRERIVTKYAQDMAFGRWKRGTYELIKVSKAGFILDGQHRLCAVIKASVTVPFHFKFNVDDTVFDVLDTGSLRNSADIFKIEGIKHDNVLPSIIQTYYGLSQGYSNVKNARLTNAQVLIEYESNPDFWQSVARNTSAWYTSMKQIMTPSLIGGVYAYFYHRNVDLSVKFMTQLTTGLGVEHDAISQLRNKMIEDKISKRKMSHSEKLGLIIKAWNYYRTGKTVKLLKFAETEAFPTAL